jgi:E-phenylitaconyl-CoA hydratase
VSSDVLQFSIDRHIAVITLNRPQALNAINGELRRALQATWQRIRDEPEIRVAVLTGAGERAFCVGSDLKEARANPPSHAEATFGDAGPDHLLAGFDTDKPVICAVNGLAIGGGLEVALACDIRICAEGAEFGMGEVRVGSIPGAGGTQRLPRAVGPSLAMYMLLTGDRIDAPAALRAGLVSEVTQAAELMPRALRIAERIAANAPLSVRATKRLAVRGPDLPAGIGLEVERMAWGIIRDTDDRAEGRTAFREKRPPVYRGR